MTTPLDKPLRRALKINGVEHVLTISPEGLKLTLKGKRNGLELKWTDLASGEAALAMALNASLGRLDSGKAGKSVAETAAPDHTTTASSNRAGAAGSNRARTAHPNRARALKSNRVRG
jgi:hypothetical protein